MSHINCQIILPSDYNGLGMKDYVVPGNMESSAVFLKRKACIRLTSSSLTSEGRLFQ